MGFLIHQGISTSSSSPDHEFLPLSLRPRLISLVLPLSELPKLVSGGGIFPDWALSAAISAASVSNVSNQWTKVDG